MESVMEKYFNDIVKTTSEIIRFDSSLKPADGEYPFGKEAAECLEYFLNLASDMGFETHNYENFVGEVIFGEGEEFAVLAHLDVVPAGSGWKYPPFGGVINSDVSDGGVAGEKIWGRGAMDDKGPAVVCLYCLKALKDEGVMPNRKIKLIVGCNEECGWKCIEHYNQVANMPKEGFTPDANFPVIYAEKGILHFTMHFPLTAAPFTALNAGERANMVCDSAMAILTRKAGNKLVAYENPVAGTTLSYDNTTNILQVRGKSAHGSHPERGANALQALLAFLASFDEECKKAYAILFEDCLNLRSLEDETGVLTMSPDVASYKNGVLSITTDIRFPATMQLSDITEKLDSLNVEYTVNNYQAPLYNDPNGALISTLTKVYADVTGKEEKPCAIGGGTYARALQCGCGFGPEADGEEDTIHQANEYITFDKIRTLSKVYYNAIKAVCANTNTDCQACVCEETCKSIVAAECVCAQDKACAIPAPSSYTTVCETAECNPTENKAKGLRIAVIKKRYLPLANAEADIVAENVSETEQESEVQEGVKLLTIKTVRKLK